MAYSSEIADLLTAQLRKFVTLNRHQLIGQVANLDFWIDETKHCLAVIDGYRERFSRLNAAVTKYTADHQTIEFPLAMPDYTEAATPPQRVPQTDLTTSRKSLCDAMYRFLLRCYREEMISENALQDWCARLGINVEYSDLNR
jgi:hypothetical protein